MTANHQNTPKTSRRNPWICGVFAALALTSLSSVNATPVPIVGWEMDGLSGYGPSPFAPTTKAANITAGGLTRGSGVGTGGSAAGNAWGGTTFNSASLSAAVSDNKFATFTITPAAGFTVSLASIQPYNIRRSGAGPTTGQWQYSLDGSSFTNIGSAITWGGTTNANGNAQSAIDLSSISALQDVEDDTTITFRLVNWDGTTGTWYFNNFQTGNDLVVLGTVEAAGDDETPPSVVSLSPANGAVDVEVDTALSITFNEAVAPGNGNVILYDGQMVVETFPAFAGTFNLATATFTPSADLDLATTYHVIVEPTAITDIAGNAFPGFASSSDWSFTTIGPDETGPVPVSFVPASGASNVPLDIPEIRISFDEPIVIAGPGAIEVRRVDDDAVVGSVAVNDTTSVSIGAPNELIVVLQPEIFESGTEYYVSVPAGSVEDALENPNLAFGEPASDIPWTFTTAAPPIVVVNKYLNGASGNSQDVTELLVIGDEVPGNTVDLRGMIVKDFSSSMAGDSGGKFEFEDVALWEAVPVGTLIVLRSGSTSGDTNPSDFVLDVGLADAALFASLGGTYDIATTEMIMIKAAGSVPEGIDGGIHALAAGSPGALFTAFTGPKLIATATTGTGLGVIANNGSSSLDDFDGSDATGGVPAASMTFGAPNNVANAVYINSLRGLLPGDGFGEAVLVNATPGSPYSATQIFGRGLEEQSVSLTITTGIPDVALTDISIEIPVDFGMPVAGSITLSGAATTSAGFTVDGQSIIISDAAITTDDALVVTIEDLETPATFASGDYGSRPFAISTSGDGGTLTPIVSDPIATVTLPISILRETDVNGVPLALGVEVAVEGVVTMSSFFTSNTQAAIQDGTAGIALFNFESPSPFTRGNRYMVIGPVGQFNGLSQIEYAGSTSIIDLGPDTEPAPIVLTIPALLADAEFYEGSLVTVENLTYVSGTWDSGQTVVLEDGDSNTLNIRIQAGSTATTEPTYPVNVTGVFDQFDSSSPFTSGYRIMPRDPDDLAPGEAPPPVGGDFATWIATFGVAPLDGPFDAPAGDGVPNILKHVFGLAPNVAVTGSLVQVANGAPGTLTFVHTRIKLDDLASDVIADYEWSQNLTDWAGDGEELGGVTVQFGEAVILDDSDPAFDVVSVTASVTDGTADKLFVRVMAGLDDSEE